MANKLSRTPCSIKMKLISKDVNVEKVCTNLWDVYIFERDMPTKYKLQFSGKPYVVGKIYLDAIERTGGN